jgi:hypothetical protein
VTTWTQKMSFLTQPLTWGQLESSSYLCHSHTEHHWDDSSRAHSLKLLWNLSDKYFLLHFSVHDLEQHIVAYLKDDRHF